MSWRIFIIKLRIDYIVPMPMNAKRMQEYVKYYDVDLDASLVTLNEKREVFGIGMFGWRKDRGWITRLGVVPETRRGGTGSYFMEHFLRMALERDARLTQLEVIKNNEPAHRLFLKSGFVETRELLIIRRPPAAPAHDTPLSMPEIRILEDKEIPMYLEARHPEVSWVEETISMLNAEGLMGLEMNFPSGETGWVIYQFTPFQLSRVVLSPQARENHSLAFSLLYYFHEKYPHHDTKIENLDVLDPTWKAFQKMGYLEVFRRIEMVHLHRT